MFRRLIFLVSLAALVTACNNGLSSKKISTLKTAQEPQLSADPESEPDFGPGFWEAGEDTTKEDLEGGENTTELIGPQEKVDRYYEEVFRQDGAAFKPMISFPQTLWNECTDPLTGNYDEAACVPRRTISTILDSYLQTRLLTCVDAGMAAQGGGQAEAIHVTHAGITADARHSPYSLHSQNRAIDIKQIKVSLKNGEARQFTYAKTGNRPFYTALRKCWGTVVHTYNSCPYYNGNVGYTGSIGWENSQHGHHMHLSVPYCISGRYGSGLWRR